MNELATIDQTALTRLREKARLEVAIETWRPKSGDTLEGVIIGSRKVSGPFGEQSQMLVQTPTGAVVAVWLTDWLLGQVRAQAAELGDLVSITYHGKEQSRTGASFNRMSVTVLKP